MIWTLLFWTGLALSFGIGLIYFRDLGDVSQMILKVKRKNMLRFIRNEYKFLAVGGAAMIVMVVAQLVSQAASDWVFRTALVAILFLYGFPWVWVHLGLRNQADSARFFSIEQAKKYVAPAASVIVIVNYECGNRRDANSVGKPFKGFKYLKYILDPNFQKFRFRSELSNSS